MLFSIDPPLVEGKMRQNFLSWAVFGILHDHLRLPGCISSVKIAALGFLKLVIERIFKISM
jgi:hypothetical protein